MALIKDGQISADPWRHLGDDEPLGAGPCTVSLTRWQAAGSDLAAHEGPLGVRLTPSDAPDTVAGDLGRLALIAFDMAPFTDGRVFSGARLLRDRYGYTGEIRARGDFLRDQMSFLARVGVNAFEFAEGVDPAAMLGALGEFTVAYQSPAGPARMAAAARR